MASQEQSNTNNNQIIGLAVLGAAGYLIYDQWYLPQQRAKRAADDLARQIAAYQARNPGMSTSDALRGLGKTICQGTALYYGVPPQLSGDVCAMAVQLAPTLLEATYKGVSAGLTATTKGIGQVGKTIVGIPEDFTKKALIRPAKQAGRAIKKFFS